MAISVNLTGVLFNTANTTPVAVLLALDLNFLKLMNVPKTLLSVYTTIKTLNIPHNCENKLHICG